MGLKKKSIEVLDYSLNNPKATQVEAYQSAHKTANYNTAASNAHRLFKKPAAQIYLKKHIDQSASNIVELGNSARSELVRLQANQDVLDRTQGKATQRTENVSAIVSINLDLGAITDTN